MKALQEASYAIGINLAIEWFEMEKDENEEEFKEILK